MDKNSKQIQLVENTTKVELICSQARRMIETSIHFSLVWLQEHDWFAVPVADPIDYPDAEWITEAVESMNIPKCYAISTEASSDVYEIEVTQEALLWFDFEASLRHFLIVPPNLQFAILFEGDFYYVIAGPKPFVRQALGYSFQTAYLMFKRYINSQSYEPTRTLLADVLNRYSAFNGLTGNEAMIRRWEVDQQI